MKEVKLQMREINQENTIKKTGNFQDELDLIIQIEVNKNIQEITTKQTKAQIEIKLKIRSSQNMMGKRMTNKRTHKLKIKFERDLLVTAMKVKYLLKIQQLML